MSDAITLQAFDLDQMDTDGAIREAGAAVEGDSRADFFRKAAVGGTALIGGGVLLGGVPELANAKPSAKQDVAILNFALTLEYLEAEFYKEAIRSGVLGGEILDVAALVSRHENAHVVFLKKALGRKAAKKPKFDFRDTTSVVTKFLATSVALEDTGVKAYSGQATRIKSPAIVKAAVSILTVEARHASRFRTLQGKRFAPLSFDRPASGRATLKTVRKTRFIKKS